MKFNAALVAVAAFATATHAAGQAVEESDFAELDAFLANINTADVAAAQSSIQAGAQPTPDASTPASPAESSQAAALAGADDGLPSEADIDKLIASAAAQFGSAGAGLLPTGGDAAAAAEQPQATARDAAQATPNPAAVDAIKGAIAAAVAVKNVVASASGVATAAAAAPTGGLVVDGGHNNGSAVWTAAAPRDAISGLAVAGLIAAYFL